MSIENKLKDFFETNPLSIQAASSIRDGREITIELQAETGSRFFVFSKQSGKNIFNEKTTSKADLTFQLPEPTALEMCSRGFGSVSEVGLFIFEKMLASDAKVKIHVKVHTGILSLVSGGYLGVLSSGGVDVAKFLASRGLSSFGKIKETISKMKKGNT